MVPFPARRADDPESLNPDRPFQSQIQPEIEELTSRLAAQGIRSTELVLDLILHDLADEARQAVGATGAALALERDGELVCRAAAGSTAPDLGVRIHTESGLSGVCVKQGSTQVCADTEADDRVDAEACRRLGVRSIVVTPLFSAAGIIGILEAFSARPNAFSAEDVRKLEALASAAAQTVKGTREKGIRSADGAEPAHSETAAESADLSVASIMQKVSPMDPAVRALRWLLIGLAIPLVILIGFDWGWHRAHAPVRFSSVAGQQKPPQPEPQRESSPTVAGPAASSAKPPNANPPNGTDAKPKSADELANRGGLVIYQNGKIIYRELPATGGKQPALPQTSNRPHGVAESVPAETKASAKTDKATEKSAEASATSPPPGITGGRLLQSVRPKYPAEAVVQKLEGAVVLHGTVGQDGVIRELKLIQGDPVLSQAALEAVQQWKYEPYRKNGAPIPMPIDITIDFNLPK
jgi:TonB family protein